MIRHIKRNLTLSYTVIIALFLAVCIGSSYIVYRYKGIQFVEAGLRDYLEEEMREAETQIRAGMTEPETYKIASDNSAHNFSYWFINKKILHAEEPQDENFASLIKKRLTSQNFQNGRIYYENIKYNKQKRYYIVLKQDLLIKGVPTGEIFVLANFTSIRKSTKNYIVIAAAVVTFATFLAWLLGNILVNRSMKYIERSYQKQKQFVSDAAHEFRTPLTILYSYAELLEYNPQKQGVIADLKNEIQQMNNIVDRLLAMARYDNSDDILRKDCFSINKLAASVIKSLSSVCPPGSIELRENAANIKIKADKTMIRQLLCILLDNAIKYTPENKKITVTLSRRPDSAQISVSDNGIGIRPEDLEHIFDRFWQAEKSRHQKGLGIGLYLADRIVRQHDGTINVQSTPGQGTTFDVTLPLKQKG